MVIATLGKQDNFQCPFFPRKAGFTITVTHAQGGQVPEGMQNCHHEQAGKQERQGQDQIIFIIDAADEQQGGHQQIEETVAGGKNKDAPLIQHHLSGRR